MRFVVVLIVVMSRFIVITTTMSSRGRGQTNCFRVIYLIIYPMATVILVSTVS